ncbi:MAG: helix-turn-helix domain-containing protein [Patescibacteria group bacterium]|nr:helix-turn-helix domain-containing protein [Patescibacteria group bacterium]
MKVRIQNLKDQDRIETLDALYTAAGAMRGRDAMKLFLRDLLTESERIMLGRRIRIARLILEGYTYGEIAAALNVGHDTVYRVHRWLSDQMPGYEKAVAGWKQALEKRGRKALQRTIFKKLKQKYPLHFLFWNFAGTSRKKQKS